MQIPLANWPAGLSREVATIDASAVAERLASRLMFGKDSDDLDAFLAAIFTIDGRPFALQLYDHVPTGDFTLIATDNPSGDDASVEHFLSWSGIPHSAVRWVRPSIVE